jgi:protein-S-isoprenylcysteine O-methyltransferase Ste14
MRFEEKKGIVEEYRSHENRPDLAGEYRLGDLGQSILLLLFLIVWILDSFILRFSTFPAEQIPLWQRLIPSAILLVLSGYLAMDGMRRVFGEVRETLVVIQEGTFRTIRHPIYLGCILFYVALCIITLSVASAGVTVIIIVFYGYLARYEERLLLARLGQAYQIYRDKVPRWIPRLFSVRKKVI